MIVDRFVDSSLSVALLPQCNIATSTMRAMMPHLVLLGLLLAFLASSFSSVDAAGRGLKRSALSVQQAERRTQVGNVLSDGTGVGVPTWDMHPRGPRQMPEELLAPSAF